jgi:hypothetical protein
MNSRLPLNTVVSKGTMTNMLDDQQCSLFAVIANEL